MVQFIHLTTTIESLGSDNKTNNVTTKEPIVILSMSASVRSPSGVLSRELARDSVTCKLSIGTDYADYQSSTPPDIFDLVESYNSANMHMQVDKSNEIMAEMKHYDGGVITSAPIIVSLVLCVVKASEYNQSN